MAQAKITVIGSLNIDMVTETDVMPQQGETLIGNAFSSFTGGKGANQAVACARLGAAVTMIGCVGEDAMAQQLRDALGAENIDMTYVKTVPYKATGIAAITVTEGDNRIIVIPGANHCLLPEDVLALKEVIAASDMVMLQHEIPLETVEASIKLAHSLGIPVILNPAPAVRLPEQLLAQLHLITPNESELAIVTGLERKNTPESLLEQYPNPIVMTAGSSGAYYKGANGELGHIPGYKVEVVDTTGAGDTFNGALAVKLSEGASLQEAAQFAVAASALSVTKLGAQSGMPLRHAVEAFIKQSN
ncbi:ribokinase [Paenibacillus algorifonticola]|uniref:Ribokinase n=1 Tax=Paenibacillus algorifonticola TaxID=684063 RepID=A0A1I2HGQ4_9BACL|nr:ribokinase [Paenibacillus algorifonticola]SFF28839.1 ribokinase [Paenibacillus algorifonticola]